MSSFPRHFRLAATLTILLAAISQLDAQTPVKQSPFLPPSGAADPLKAGPTPYELAGMSVAGKATLLSITRVRDKRSIWVPVGQTVGEVTAVSFNPESDQAVIRADGQLLTLSMRKSAVVSGPAARMPYPTPPPSRGPMAPAQPPVVAIPPPPANAQEEKETEARMLVTDLLEIGQEQRRAYEEAQRQAALKNARPAAAK